MPTDPRVWPECLALRDAGWAVTVVCPAWTRDDALSEEVDGIEIRRFRPSESSGRASGYLSEYAMALRGIRRVVRELSRTHVFDVVHAATPPDVLLLAALSLRRRGAATILDHHDLSPELYEAKFGKRGPLHRSLLLAERLGFRLADVVISPNESFRLIAIERGGKAPEDVFVVRNGPDPSVFRRVAPDPTLARGARHLIGFVGRMGRQDGVREALTALEKLVDLRTDWHAVFAGDGEALESAKQVVAGGKLAGRVTFLGFVLDQARVVEILSSCDVCISPEPRNALNEKSTLIKIAEYMAVGCPVVAFDLHETAETARGAALRVADASAFAHAISRLLDDSALRARMGEEGRARVVEDLAWTHSVPSLLDAYARARARVKDRRRGSESPR
jgi:glycosyltransferase involved in cell wall biosynthesis